MNEEIPGTYIKPDGTLGLIRCPKCGEENYVMAVTFGICIWCGFDANKVVDDERL